MDSAVPLVPEYRVVDLFDPRLAADERAEILEDYTRIHLEYFPEYPHVIEEYRVQVETGIPPEGERPHAWLVRRDGEPVGTWGFNVDRASGVVLMLFGAIHRKARIDLPIEYLRHLVDHLLDLCVDEAHARGESLVAGILESDPAHLHRWQRCGFFVADPEYHEPKHGRSWRQHGDVEFFEQYQACVKALDSGLSLSRADLATRALRALLVSHYQLPPEHEQVLRSLANAAAVADEA